MWQSVPPGTDVKAARFTGIRHGCRRSVRDARCVAGTAGASPEGDGLGGGDDALMAPAGHGKTAELEASCQSSSPVREMMVPRDGRRARMAVVESCLTAGGAPEVRT